MQTLATVEPLYKDTAELRTSHYSGHCCGSQICIQWNLSITDTIGESQFVRYREVSLVERFDI